MKNRKRENENLSILQQYVRRNESNVDVEATAAVAEEVFGDNRLLELTSNADMNSRMEVPCQDTKILFRSQNYPAMESTDSSTKSRSKVLRYKYTNNIPPATLNSRESLSSVSVKCLRKKLPFSEFQL